MGLAIARENARLHGGDLTVTSELGLGSRFTCTIPRRTGPPDAGDAVPVVPVAQPLPARDPADMTARHDRVMSARRKQR